MVAIGGSTHCQDGPRSRQAISSRHAGPDLPHGRGERVYRQGQPRARTLVGAVAAHGRDLHGHHRAEVRPHRRRLSWSTASSEIAFRRLTPYAARRYVPGGEWALFKLNTWGIRRHLDRRGTPTGHGAGTGSDISTHSHTDEPRGQCPVMASKL